MSYFPGSLHMIVTEFIEAKGHPNISAKNKKTFEITKENWLTERGDCIVAVGANKGITELDKEFKYLAKNESAKISVIFEVEELRESVIGYGNPELIFEHPTDLVARKSRFICSRTLMNRSNKAASDFSREFIKRIRDSNQKINIHLMAQVKTKI
jgi:hypothetical protein